MTTTLRNTRQTQVANPKAAELTFGIEIECFLPRGSVTVGAYHRGIELGGEFPAGWNAQRDASLRTNLRRYEGVEIVSPVLKGADGLAQVRKVAELLNRLDAKVNVTCGFHCHVGVTSAAGTDFDEVADWVRRLLNTTAQHELAFYGAAGTTRRRNGTYCKSLARGDWSDKKQTLKKKKLTADELRLEAAGISRYQLLNIVPVFSRNKTVEFRCFSGTTEAIKMTSWIQMCLAVANRAQDRDTAFDAPRAEYASDGAAGAMRRFFYLTGWTRGRKDYYKPECIVEGWVDDLANLSAAKRELMRLARKYDKGARS